MTPSDYSIPIAATNHSPRSTNSSQENISPTPTTQSWNETVYHSPRPYTKHPYYAQSPYSMHPAYNMPRRYISSRWNQSQQTAVKCITPSTTFTDDISKSIRDAFIPPRHKFTSRPESSQSESKKDQSKTTFDGVTFMLRDSDIVCGRGAPSSCQQGNQLFKDLVEEFQTSYLCSKRTEKPKIAMFVMDEVRRRGGRFVRRVKTTTNGRSFGWEELEDKRSYEKVCQALREGAPELRRKMMASAKIQEDLQKVDNNSSTSPLPYFDYNNSVDSSFSSNSYFQGTKATYAV
eukprot:scaffold1697_cov120-Cylindrotheca_fusiformis.AAC.8